MRGQFWTPAMDAQLREWHAAGMSAREIAFRLGDVTRNSVIGRANRLGLKTVAGMARRSVAIRRKETARRVAREAKLPPLGAICGSVPATLALERDSCRFPVGNPGEATFHYCMDPQIPGRPYCAEHESITHSPVLDRPLSKRAWREEQRLLRIERRAVA